MALLIQAAQRNAAAGLLNASFELRHRILVQRLGWQLPSGTAALETDAFDGGDTNHLISLTADGRVRGTLRLTPSLSPNLTCDVLQRFVATPIPRGPAIVECSRLCIDVDLPPSERLMARADLFLAQLELCKRYGWTQTVGLLLQSVLQYFLRSGLQFDLLSPPLQFTDDKETSLAFLLESGDAALATARAVLRLQHALQDLIPAHHDAALEQAA